MKILIIGGHGTIGHCVAKHFSKKHNVIIAGRTAGDVKVDLTDSASIEALFENMTELDAVVCIAGEAKWDRMDTMTEEDYYIGIRSKLMGQVNLTRIATKHLKPGGSITLSTGILADDPVEFTTSAAMVNGAINSFTKAAALEMTNGMRINVVSSGLVEDSAVKYADYFPGHDPVPMSKIVNAYVKCVEGKIQGEVVHVRG